MTVPVTGVTVPATCDVCGVLYSARSEPDASHVRVLLLVCVWRRHA